MTALNKQALRVLAVALDGEDWHTEGNSVYGGRYDVGDNVCYDHIASCESVNGESPHADFIAAAKPATVLALLDELEAAEKRIAELSVSLKDLIGVVNTVNRSRHHEIKMDDDDDPCYWQRKDWIEYLMETVSAAEGVYRAAGIGVNGE